MKSILCLMIMALMAYVMPVASQDLDEVLKKYYEANDMHKLSKLKSVKYTGKSYQMGMETPFTTIMTSTGKYRLEVPVQGQMMVQAFDGETGWMIAPWTGNLDPIDMDALTVKRVKQQVDITGPLYNYAEKGYATELLGKEDLEGTEVYVVKQVDPDQNEFKHYIDAENYVILKTHTKMKIQENEMEFDQSFGNYKEIDGILLSTTMENRFNGQVQSQINVEKAEFDIEIDDSLFKKPAKSAPVEEQK